MDAELKLIQSTPFILALIFILLSPLSGGFFDFAIRGWFAVTHGGIAPALVQPLKDVSTHLVFLNGALLTLFGSILGVIPFLRQSAKSWLLPIDLLAIVFFIVLLWCFFFIILPIPPSQFGKKLKHFQRITTRQVSGGGLVLANGFFIFRVWAG